MNRLESALSNAVSVLAQEGFGAALVGGLAVSARAEPRFTRDIDLAVAVESDSDAERLVARLLERGYRVLAQVEQDSTGRLATVRLVPPGASPEGVVVDLLFASSGIEPEIVHQADTLRLSDTFAVPVARLEHLLALKLLSRDDLSRPQDRTDILALLREANPDELAACRGALRLIEQRGYARDKQLLDDLNELLSGGKGNTA